MDSGDSLLRDMGKSPSAAPSGTAQSAAGKSGASPASGAAGAAPRQTSSGSATPSAGASMTGSAAASGNAPSGMAGGSAPAASAGAGGSSASSAGMTGAAGGGAGAMMAAGGSGGSAAMATGPSMGTLTLKFTTKSYGGQYAPGNYGAVWFESAGGDFVKTVKRWAGAAHAGDLGTWNEASGGWGSLFGGGGNMADMMDAMSSATLRQHESHTVMWNMKDADKTVVPDGDYVAVVELTEDRAATPGPVLRIPFKKGPEPQMVEPPDEMSFTDITLTYQP